MDPSSRSTAFPNPDVTEATVSRAAESVVAIHPGFRALLGRVSVRALATALVGLAHEIASPRELCRALVERFADRFPAGQQRPFEEWVEGVVLRIA